MLGSAAANSAMSGSSFHPTWKNPTAGLNKKRKSTELTATELARVLEKMAWKTLMPLS